MHKHLERSQEPVGPAGQILDGTAQTQSPQQKYHCPNHRAVYYCVFSCL